MNLLLNDKGPSATLDAIHFTKALDTFVIMKHMRQNGYRVRVICLYHACLIWVYVCCCGWETRVEVTTCLFRKPLEASV
jgi:hypothetical protein